MPQPKSSSARPRKGTRAAAPANDDENVARGVNALRALLARAIMLPTERVRETLDDAVRRGRMTRSDAEDLAQALINAGRRQTEDLMADVEQLLGRRGKRAPQGSDRIVREVDKAKRAAGLSGSFPISNYDDLAAAQITSRLDDLSPAELRKVRDYERRHGNRKTVLSAIERKLG
jgi:polyhydroxyalkanoate synthesis regulator phasin